MSVYLGAIFIALLLAQGSKVVTALLRGKKDEWRLALTRSGGMPSAHTALVVSIATVLGVENGVDSAVFALSLVVALVVMYDSINVRRSVGEQGTAMRQLIKELKLAADGYNYKQAEGHHPGEVLVGIFAGILAAVVSLYFL